MGVLFAVGMLFFLSLLTAVVLFKFFYSSAIKKQKIPGRRVCRVHHHLFHPLYLLQSY